VTDRRYGVNQYGDGALYGPSDERTALAWDTSIDWDEDGLLDENEAGLLTGVKINRGRTRLLRQLGGGFETVRTGKAILTYKNLNGRYDGWNSLSPLYPNIGYGKDIRVRVRDLSDNSADPYPLFRGTITNIVPTGTGRDAKVVLHASDGLEYLRNNTARVAIQTEITPDEAMALLLDAVNWPSRWGRDLDVSAETIRYWWTSGEKKAMSEIEDLALSFLGYFFCDASGRARYIKRSNVSALVASYAQEYLLKDIGNPQPFELKRNVTRLKVHPRTSSATVTLYQLVGVPPSVLPGAANAERIFPNYTYNGQPVPAINVVVSLFEANTQSDFLGTDRTAQCTAVLTDFGDGGMVEITNNSAGLVYYRLELEGNAIYEPNTADVTYPKDLSTILALRELVMDLRWQQDLNVGRDIADVLGPFYSDLHPMPNIKIENRPSLQFAPDLFGIVGADIGKLGVSGYSFRVGGIEHATDAQLENCQKVTTRLYLEPYISANDYMQWDTNSVWDTSTVFGW